MELNITHLYQDLLNVYGDIGNIIILKHRCKMQNIKCNIKTVSIGEYFDDKKTDIAFLFGGQDNEQSIVSIDIKNNKKDNIKNFIEEEKTLIAICGGMQILGKYYKTIDGHIIEGLDVLDLYTIASNNRKVGNIIIKSNFCDDYLIGFENHSGLTYLGKNIKPLGKVVFGEGNNDEDDSEGCIYKNTIGSYLHGPLFSKNPKLVDKIIKTAIDKKYKTDFELKYTENIFEQKAREYILNNYIKKERI